MSLIKTSSLEKRAVDPFTIGIGAFKAFQHAKDYGARALSVMAGTNLHNVDKLVLAPKNTWSQRALLADSIIALKRGTEGKVLATRKPMTMLAFGDPETHMKLLGEQHINSIGQQATFGKTLFDKNKFNTQRLKNILESSGDFKDAIRADVGKRTAKTVQNIYTQHRRSGMSEAEALLKSQAFGMKLHARLSEKTFPTMQNLDLAHKYHNMLSTNNGYGYKALEQAAPVAEKVMQRPGLFNYSKHMYATPEVNRNSIGKYPARIMQYASGQNPNKLSFWKFLKHGTGESLTPIHKVTEKAESLTLQRLQQIANQNNINEKITPEHIGRLADQLPSIRQDLIGKTNRFILNTKHKIFNN